MSKRSFVHALVICAAMPLWLVAIPGCISSPDDDPPDILPVLPLRNSIEKTIEFYEFAWRHQVYTDYEALLHDQFEFFPLEHDVSDFPWMTGPSWDKAEEMNFALHMFDPNYLGQRPPVDSIEFDLTELSRRDLGNNRTEVTCALQGRVLTAPNDGWSFDTLVILEIVPDPDEPGLLQVIKQTEVDAVRLREVDAMSWAHIKNQYR